MDFMCLSPTMSVCTPDRCWASVIKQRAGMLGKAAAVLLFVTLLVTGDDLIYHIKKNDCVIIKTMNKLSIYVWLYDIICCKEKDYQKEQSSNIESYNLAVKSNFVEAFDNVDNYL